MDRREALNKIFYAGLAISTASIGGFALDCFGGPGFATDCLKRPELEKILEKEYQVRIIGNTSEQTLTQLKEALENVDSTLDKFREHLSSISYLDLPYKVSPISLIFPRAGAMTNTFTKGIKFTENITPEYLAHELGHVWHTSLEKKKEFDKKWKAIANIKYERGLEGVKNGCISSYGASGFVEDVATFCANIQRIKDGLQKKEIPYWYSNGGTDKRFIEKVKLLREYGFITPEEFEIVKPYYTDCVYTGNVKNGNHKKT